jgi:hypothetical protein
MWRKILKIVCVLFILFVVSVGLTSINHPMILKWVTGSARHFGMPMSATVYTNGEMNDLVKIFYSDDGDNYILSLAEQDSSGMSKFVNINLDEGWIGSPLGMSKNDYDIIAGHLFLSETAEHFFPFEDGLAGRNFDPLFFVTDRQIKFTLPPDKFEFDSVRIQLP